MKWISRKKYYRNRTSPIGGNRACLCEDNTYHLNCCDGSNYAQGVGKTESVNN